MVAKFAGFEQPAPVIEARREAPNHALAMQGLENDFLFKNVTPEYLAHQEREIYQHFPGQEDGRVRAFEGALMHEKAEGDYRLFLLHAFYGKGDKSPNDFSRNEVEAAYASFPDRARMEQEEQGALARYHEGTRTFWKGKWVDTNDFRALALDIRARQASRLTDDAERAHAIEKIDQTHKQLIELTSDPGRRFEHMMVYLLRHWAQQAHADHVFDVRHALPREDMAEATDVVCSFGAQQFNLQQKALANDSYREAHHGEVLAKAKQRTMEKGSRLFVVEPQELQEAYVLTTTAEGDLGPEKKRRLNALRKKIVSLLGSVTSPELESALLGEKPKRAETAEKGKKLTDAFIAKNSAVPQLVRFGLLDMGMERDVKKLMDAKRRLSDCLPAVRSVVKTQEAWMDPSDSTIQAVRAVCGLGGIAAAAE